MYGEDETKTEFTNTTYLNSLFDIDPDLGTVFVKSDLDRETAELIRLTIHVTDLNAYDPPVQTATGRRPKLNILLHTMYNKKHVSIDL